jgi:hypothetical protein
VGQIYLLLGEFSDREGRNTDYKGDFLLSRCFFPLAGHLSYSLDTYF